MSLEGLDGQQPFDDKSSISAAAAAAAEASTTP